MNGPPLVIYGAMRRWSAPHFRATLQGYFLPASAIGMLSYWALGLWTPTVTRFSITSLPGVVVAIALGRLVNQRMSARRFVSAVYLGLMGVAGVLLIQSLASSR